MKTIGRVLALLVLGAVLLVALATGTWVVGAVALFCIWAVLSGKGIRGSHMGHHGAGVPFPSHHGSSTPGGRGGGDGGGDGGGGSSD